MRHRQANPSTENASQQSARPTRRGGIPAVGNRAFGNVISRNFWERRPGAAKGKAGITWDDWHSEEADFLWARTGEADVNYYTKSYPVYRMTKKGANFMTRLRDLVGADRAEHFRKVQGKLDSAGFKTFSQLVHHATPHKATLAGLGDEAFNALSARNLAKQRDLFQSLTPDQFAKVLDKPPAKQKDMFTGKEFSNFADMAKLESRFAKVDATPRNPKSAQGSHFLSEHGTHNSLQDTVILAADYALKMGKTTARKGNWLSHSIEKAALDWAGTRVDLSIQQARLATTAANSDTTLTALDGGDANIFETAKVREAINPAKTFSFGSSTVQKASATARLAGDFRDAAAVDHPGAVKTTVTGVLTNKPAGGVAIPAPQNAEVVKAEGPGLAKITATGVTSTAPNEIAGSVNARARLKDIQITAKVGQHDFVDGVATVNTMFTKALDTAGGKTAWALAGNDVTGEITGQNLIDGGGSKLASPELPFKVAKSNPDGSGTAITAKGSGYVKRIKKVKNGAHVRNLKGTLELGGAKGAMFQPDTLKAIAENTKVTSRESSYLEAGQVKQMRLLKPSVKVRGTLGDLKTAGLVPSGSFWSPGPTTVSSLSVEIDNFAREDASTAPDILAEKNPTAGTTYSITRNGKTYEFRISTLNPSPAQTDFQALMYLKDQDVAEYTPFTAY